MKAAKIHHSPPTNWLILTHLGPRDREVNGSGSHEKHGTPLATTPTRRHVGISMMIVEHEKCNRKKPGGVKKLYCYMMWKRSVSKWKNECENDIEKTKVPLWCSFCCGKQLCYPKSGSGEFGETKLFKQNPYT